MKSLNTISTTVILTSIVLNSYACSADIKPLVDINSKERYTAFVFTVNTLNDTLINNLDINLTLVKPLFIDRASGVVKSIAKRTLNEKETAYVQRNKINSLRAGFCLIGAESRTIGIEGRRNGKADALRHAFWAACMTKYLGKEEAKKILDNHEYRSSDKMDEANNEFGMMTGEKMKNMTTDDIWNSLQTSAKNGLLIWNNQALEIDVDLSNRKWIKPSAISSEKPLKKTKKVVNSSPLTPLAEIPIATTPTPTPTPQAQSTNSRSDGFSRIDVPRAERSVTEKPTIDRSKPDNDRTRPSNDRAKENNMLNSGERGIRP